MQSKRIDYKESSNRELIELYLVSDEGTVELNDKQKTLLSRWEYADELIRRNEMKREDIVKMIQLRFKPLSRITAYQDIVNAEAVFSSSTPLNKKYRIQLRIEFIERKISELYGLIYLEPVDEAGNKIPLEEESIDARIGRIKWNQEYLHEAKELEKVLQKYYHDYPDVSLPRAPRTINYLIIGGNMPAPNLTVDQALEQAGKILHFKANDPDGSNK